MLGSKTRLEKPEDRLDQSIIEGEPNQQWRKSHYDIAVIWQPRAGHVG